MKNLYLDSLNYDLTLKNFNLRFTEDVTEYVSQKIENELKTFKKEWFLNRDIGIPYFDRVLIKKADLDDVNNIFRTVVSSIPEVKEVLKFDTFYDNNTRTYTINFKVKASEVIIEGSTEV